MEEGGFEESRDNAFSSPQEKSVSQQGEIGHALKLKYTLFCGTIFWMA